MDTMKLGNGQQIPAQGFGVFLVENNGPCEAAVSKALQAGYRLIDTAAAYFNETDVGKAIRNSGIDCITSRAGTRFLLYSGTVILRPIKSIISEILRRIWQLFWKKWAGTSISFVKRNDFRIITESCGIGGRKGKWLRF